MSGDWATDSEEFADRMMEKILSSAQLVGAAVELEEPRDMVAEVLDEMGVCSRCLKRGCSCTAPERTGGFK